MTEVAVDDKPHVSTTEDRWVFDKKIPLASIITLGFFVIAQSAGMVWWMSAQAARLDEMNSRLVVQEQIKASDRLAALEALLPRIEAQLNRIEGKLDQIQTGR